MSAAVVKAWLRPRLRRGWLAVDRWLMPDPSPALAHLWQAESRQLSGVQRRLARGLARRCRRHEQLRDLREVHER